jgi:putative ABC transport system permease protein
MSTLRAWFRRVGGLFGKERRDRELAEEMESHLQMHIEDNLRTGMSAEEARRQALIKLGGIEQAKENYRDRRGIPWLESVLQDVRFSLRMLRKNPGFTTVAVLTLALGIGANTSIFSMVNAILFRALPYRQPQQLYVINEDVPQFDSQSPWTPSLPVNAGNFLLWHGQCPAVSSMALIGQTTLNVTGEGAPRQVRVLRVSSDFFSMMNIRPQLGRSFLPGEDELGRDHELILTAQFWRRVFNSDAGIIGKSVTLDTSAYTVVGIMPESFQFPELPELSKHTPDFFKPFGFQERDFWSGLGGFNYIVLGRLKPGASQQEASAQLNVVEARIARQGDARRHVAPGEFDLRATLRPLKTVIVGNAQAALWMLMAAAGFVLLIVCVNLASLMLARNLDRIREVAVRSALGATRQRLVRQFLAEGLILTSAGGWLGLLLASLGLRFLVRHAPMSIPRVSDIHIDVPVALFTVGASVASVLLFALLPAFRLSKVQPVEALKAAAPTASGANETVRLRSMLAVSQIALCGVILAGALLLVESFRHVAGANQWMDEDHVLSVELAVPPTEFRTTQQANQFFSRVLEKVRALPGVQSAGVTSRLPLLGPAFVDGIDFREASQSRGRPEVGQFRFVSPGYFQTVALPLVAGRWLSESDSGKDVALISESVARNLLSGRNPIGMHLLWAQLPPPTPHEIIGVVADIRNASDGPVAPSIYLPLWTFYQQESALVVRSHINPTALERSISQAVWSVDPQVAIPQERTLKTIVASSEATRRYETSLGTVFASFALLLAGLGVYGVVSYSVRRRTHEIGIRMALGAQPSRVLRSVLVHGGRLALAGIALGLLASLGLMRLMATMLFGVTATDPRTLAAVAVILLAVSLLACWIPARRATRVDPMVALRYE